MFEKLFVKTSDLVFHTISFTPDLTEARSDRVLQVMILELPAG